MKVLRTILVLTAMFPWQTVHPCSLAPGYELFKFSSPNVDGIAPETPVFEGYELKRGFNDGNPASCSDAGVLELKFKRTHGIGYLIEPVSEFEGNVFPADIIQTTKYSDYLSFVWLDWPRKNYAKLDLAIRVTAFNATGQHSRPIEIRVVQLDD